MALWNSCYDISSGNHIRKTITKNVTIVKTKEEKLNFSNKYSQTMHTRFDKKNNNSNNNYILVTRKKTLDKTEFLVFASFFKTTNIWNYSGYRKNLL